MTTKHIDPNSMTLWFPKIENLDIPQPKTLFVPLTPTELGRLYKEALPNSVVDKVREKCKEIGYPVFVRTDLSSGKHQWDRSCFIESDAKLSDNLYEIQEFNVCVELSFVCFVVREYIPMDERFKAFGGMPVNPERRYFVRNGKVVCHHPYWVEDAIGSDSRMPSVDNWRELTKEVNTETPDEVYLLTQYAETVSALFPGYWSVDFCKAKDGRWILIDMALGEASWHERTCKWKPSEIR